MPDTEKKWRAYKKANIVPEYIKDGLLIHFRGEDPYDANNYWVDSVSGYKLNGVGSGVSHDPTDKCYHSTNFGGMTSDCKLPLGEAYSFEVVFRDLKSVVSKTTGDIAVLVGGHMDGWSPGGGITIFTSTRYGDLAICTLTGKEAYSTYYGYPQETLVANAMDTFSIVPGVGVFHNGVRVANCGESVAESTFNLFRYSGGQYSRYYYSKGAKVHSVRYYNRKLSTEEVANNYKVDKFIYGE